jgi:hypothetical protein
MVPWGKRCCTLWMFGIVLARRGIIVETVPVVVLAGKSNASSDKKEICCLQAHIKIPKNCGPGFVYSVDEIVAFDGTAGFTLTDIVYNDMILELRESRDKRAIAIYISRPCVLDWRML